jgi:ABC-type uncharacterized transport system ATPase subunit
LTPQEIEGLFQMMHRLVGNGNSIIFISYKLDEVMALSDRVTVLRAGVESQLEEIGLMMAEGRQQRIEKRTNGRRENWRS